MPWARWVPRSANLTRRHIDDTRPRPGRACGGAWASAADAEPREGLRRGAGLLEDLAHGLLGILGERLLEQDVLLEGR